jgi:hypothetical protein
LRIRHLQEFSQPVNALAMAAEARLLRRESGLAEQWDEGSKTVVAVTSPFWGFPYSVVWSKMPEIPEIWNSSA